MTFSKSLQSAGLVLAGAVSAAVLMQVLGGADAATSSKPDTYKLLSLFGDVFDRVRSDYVEVPDEKLMIESAINGMLTSLDPHSSYMNAKEFQDMNEKTTGEFGGLGIEVTMENGVIKVVAPYDGTPAAKAGLMANDLIVRIDKTDVQGLTLNEAVDKMRGAVGSPITLMIVRDGKAPFEVKLTRDIIKVESVKFNVESNDIGYIRMSSFTQQSDSGVRKAIEEMDKTTKNGIKGYILDLRNNPGGLLLQAVAVSDDFLDGGEVVSTRGRNPDDVERHNAQKGDLINGKPIVVLINGGSASASEIVAGALQDHKRSIVMGSQTFGKGSVQTILPLGNNTAIKLTTARYYTPNGQSIQAKGITPDVPDETDSGDDERLRESDLNRHLSNGKKTEKKTESDPDKATKKSGSEKKNKKNKNKNDKTPVEFGSEGDLLLIQAMNYFKGIKTPVTEKKLDETDS